MSFKRSSVVLMKWIFVGSLELVRAMPASERAVIVTISSGLSGLMHPFWLMMQ